MKHCIVLFVLIQLVVVPTQVTAADVERKQTTKQTLRFGAAGGDRVVIVDNVFGSILVKGYDGDDVRVTIRKTIEARSDDRAAEAEAEVTLDISEENNVIELYVNGPFRDRRSRGVCWRGYEREGYRVIYDFDIEIPTDCAVELKTVSEGDVTVSGVAGDFDVSNVNGGIEMKALRGSGAVYAVNGDVMLEFDTNPGDDCSVETINGDVRLYFQPDLSADFYLKTMNGEAFTDFEVDALPGRIKTANVSNGANVYKIARMSGIRAGRGGPEIELNTLNGDMFILSR